jgi:GxxExxY protein
MITEIKNKIPVIKEKDPLTQRIIASAFKVHSELGPGFNEKIYHNALKIALSEENLRLETRAVR